MLQQEAIKDLLVLVILNFYAPLWHSVCEPEEYSLFENRNLLLCRNTFQNNKVHWLTDNVYFLVPSSPFPFM